MNLDPLLLGPQRWLVTRSFFGLALLACMLAIGCSKVVKPDSAAPVSTSSSTVKAGDADLTTVLEYAHAFPKLSLEAQKQELATLQQSPADLRLRLKLALAYSLSTSKVKDVPKALSILEGILADKSQDAATLGFAMLLRDYLNDTSKASQRLREEQRRADTAQQKLDELQKKLDDLKLIEKTMGDRDPGVRK